MILHDVSASIGRDSGATSDFVTSCRAFLPPNARVHEVAFASAAWPGDPPPQADLDSTNIEGAIDYARALLSGHPNGHIVLFSDGRATVGNAIAAAARSSAAGYSIDVVPVGQKTAAPTRILDVAPPQDARVGVPANVLVRIASSRAEDVRVTIVDQDSAAVGESTVSVLGQRVIAIPVQPKRTGMHRWSIHVHRRDDGHSSTDATDLWFDVAGPPKLLLSDPEPLDAEPLKRVLEGLSFSCNLVAPSTFPRDPESLNQYDAILISDWPSGQCSSDQAQLLQEFVAGGGGLIFLGGTHVETKRWRGSAIERLLPINFVPEAAEIIEQMKPVHVCYVLDVSGSMDQSIGLDAAGRPVSKFVMMKEAVRSSVAELPSSAIVSLVVFDEATHSVLEGIPVSNRAAIDQGIQSLEVGGGTDLAPAVQVAADLLVRSTVSKHLILLTDGISLSYPDADMCVWLRSADIAVTTVAIGPDSDRDILARIADQSGGEYYYCGDALSIPRLFLKHARTIKTLATMPRMPFEPRPGPQPQMLKDLSADSWPVLEAAVPAEAKDGKPVQVPLVTDRHQPLLAVWSMGSGRVAAFLSDCKPIWAKRWLEWALYKRFWACMLRAVLRATPDYTARVDVQSGSDECTIFLSVRDKEGRLVSGVTPTGSFQVDANSALATTGSALDRTSMRWRQLPSGRFQGTAVLRPGPRYRYDIELHSTDGNKILSRHGVVSSTRSKEMADTGPAIDQLRALTDVGGGLFAPTPSQLCDATASPSPTSRNAVRRLWPWCVALALMLWPIDVAVRRYLT